MYTHERQHELESKQMTNTCCTAKKCEQALNDYLAQSVLALAHKPSGPSLVCWEHQANELPIRLSFAIKVY